MRGKKDDPKTYCLLLTACVDPNRINKVKNLVARIDPKVRLDDYKRALLFWNEYECKAITSIIFVENSGSDLTEICQLVKGFKRKVEVLQFEGSEIPKGLHYGYSEIEMIDFAFDHSKSI